MAPLGSKVPEHGSQDRRRYDSDVGRHFSHFAWVQRDRKSGGLGDLKYALISDFTKSISKSYGVLIPDQGKFESGFVFRFNFDSHKHWC
ncbi:hypothetical protein LOK49_LG14G00722 [Camellia lanceoleosa]|uniref:Uncharacterized protein n=1 Tax=Camellia lanceoleosa TaxID=1840588 RepID=A0ACC0FH53_9ERIC|nr:hypothetical protein LOK49_LG14G00722 [Camellia lanceoleosa]